ncbi:hypothetical protein [Paraburkholderia hospita]|uniref:hypothetical protein n=1 Tax=Paraburkholderia hospita TaxID=169430 RepID=UPI00105412DF|nr:hypothetical protein [Paraburkholderia hospita]
MTVILSDGDMLFPRCKIEPFGLREAVDGCVLIYILYEERLDAVAKRYPARRYEMIYDKLRILRGDINDVKRLPDDDLSTLGALPDGPSESHGVFAARHPDQARRRAGWPKLIWPRCSATAQQATHNRRHHETDPTTA